VTWQKGGDANRKLSFFPSFSLSDEMQSSFLSATEIQDRINSIRRKVITLEAQEDSLIFRRELLCEHPYDESPGIVITLTREITELRAQITSYQRETRDLTTDLLVASRRREFKAY
jgi:hypothetical protein